MVCRCDDQPRIEFTSCLFQAMRPVLLLICLLGCISFGQSAPATARVLIVVGPSTHAPGTHEVEAGGRVMKHCVETMANVPGVKAEVVYAWPDKALRESASTVVFIGDTFPAARFPNVPQNLADIEAMMKRGCGIVCVHYATGLWGQDVASDGEHPLLGWLGGYFANKTCPHHQGTARVFAAATITPAVAHPITRGWHEFTIHDEPYINNYFGKGGNKLAANVTAIATSLLPPEAPKRETVAWCVERADGGRGFAIVMPHFYKNWGHEDLRRCILNGIVWTAKLEVPLEGVQTSLPDLSSFQPKAVEFVPKPAPPAEAKRQQ
jgi:type 1 glutamine amidotransferase